ncbi:DNA primase [Ramlibacter alkalitolerans]|uniref:DNA primase n=1 Tax=Ramlibacter alkalitolerans TaxID=2039631 RepID=A0ABS1JW66_9BURK|nr:DNA primase [Ramlibacter alkalitolerans]MBL0428101.1 DNA primase [Ramlibacter alkalitolerans]
MAIPQNFIQDLLSRADIVEIVGRHVQLKKGGANYLGLCPFHGEKTPSFTVSPSKQFYHCFGCGKHGNAIGFLMDYASMNFVEAVKDLAGQYAMQVPDDERSPEDRARAAQQRERQQTLTDVLEKAGAAWRKHLRQSPRAIGYFKARGVSGEIAKQFGLGYAPEGWRTLAGVFPNYDDPLLAESGLVIVNEEDDKRYDRFRDRVMFPIRNVKGECIGFGGRVLGDDKPKYLNSPETPVFSKGRELYGLFEARSAIHEQGFVLVTEGYMDVVALAQLGFPNAVATLGTACTPDHVQKLFRFTDHVVFSFDGDAAGRRAARKALDGALPYATDVRTVKFLFLPPEHDPDSYIREHGQEAFARFVRQAVPLSTFLVEASAEDCDLATAEGRSQMVSKAGPLWKQLPDGALKRQLLGELADRAQLGSHELLEIWGVAAPGSARPRSRERRGGEAPYGKRAYGAGRRQAIKPKAVAFAEQVARIALRNSAVWHALSNDDHHLLCELQPPHGDLFSWLDTRFHEHGGEPWAVLQLALEGQPFVELANRLVDLDNMQPIGRAIDVEDFGEPELQRALIEIHLDALNEEQQRIVQLPSTDPSRTERLYEVIRRTQELTQRRQALLQMSRTPAG